MISGQVRRAVIGSDAFQETNVVGVTRPITKHNFLVKDIRNLKYILEKAFFIAETGLRSRSGRYSSRYTERISEKIKELTSFSAKDIPGYDPFPKLNPSLLKQAWQLIKKTKKPYLRWRRFD